MTSYIVRFRFLGLVAVLTLALTAGLLASSPHVRAQVVAPVSPAPVTTPTGPTSPTAPASPSAGGSTPATNPTDPTCPTNPTAPTGGSSPTTPTSPTDDCSDNDNTDEDDGEDEGGDDEDDEDDTDNENEDTGGGGGGSTNNGNGSGSRGNNGSNTNEDGQVLGASTGPQCAILLTDYLRQGMMNDSSEVMKLQQFLNDEMGSGLPVTGFFGAMTHQAVNTFQSKYADEVLAPWVPFGLASNTTTTGYVYKTTMWKVNEIACAEMNATFPLLP